jgi:hypothetical protein
MILLSKPKYEVVYTLTDMPEEIIQRDFHFSGLEKTDENYENFKKDYLYEHLPAELRIKAFPFEFNDFTLKSQIEQKVEKAREYIISLGYTFKD